MNFLDLYVELVREAGITGNPPTTVVGQIGLNLKAVKWIEQAWKDIQIAQVNWLFMNKTFSFDTIIGQRDYTAAGVAITDLKYWDDKSFLIHETAIDESDQNALKYLAYGKWRDGYRIGMGVRDADRPVIITRLSDNSIRFEPQPDKVYTIQGDYKRSTQILDANIDVPTGLPDDLHYIIVWKALMMYADDQSAPDSLEKAQANFQPLWTRMLIEQLPDMDISFEALA